MQRLWFNLASVFLIAARSVIFTGTGVSCSGFVGTGIGFTCNFELFYTLKISGMKLDLYVQPVTSLI